MLVKYLVKHGNSYALVIDAPILALLNMDADSAIAIKTDGRTLTIGPVVKSDDCMCQPCTIERMGADIFMDSSNAIDTETRKRSIIANLPSES